MWCDSYNPTLEEDAGGEGADCTGHVHCEGKDQIGPLGRDHYRPSGQDYK